jgi:hypothetical protein
MISIRVVMHPYSIALWTLLPILCPVGIQLCRLFASAICHSRESCPVLQDLHHHHREIVHLRLGAGEAGYGFRDVGDQRGGGFRVAAHDHFP